MWGQDDPPLYHLRTGDYRILAFVLEKEVRVTEILQRSPTSRSLD